eukprot:TRINITY_DN6987_c0_g1_i1.p1 TRINITY_DN6987_c0_g1~~TRINITY_DN6987_c0_g1_i1.p1  ORF type:complete len:192 (-),score=65.99 TRINITY_DN6987_c0_g1_i1:47-622(-)
MQFNNIAPRTREERTAMKHKDAIEKTNLAIRKGGYQSSASEEISSPDPKSTYYLPEAERFDRDYAVHEKKEREERWLRRMQETEKRKMEQLNRDSERWRRMDEEQKHEDAKLQKLRDTCGAGKKNLSSAAYNPITLEYDPTENGIKLKQADDMAKYRAQLRSYNIDTKSNCGYTHVPVSYTHLTLPTIYSV